MNNMKKYFILAAVLSLNSVSAQAALNCQTLPTCAELGFTEDSSTCSGGLTCPFDETKKWCPEAVDTGGNDGCTLSGKPFSCTGENYAGGNGTACAGQYAECECVSSAYWYKGECRKGAQLYLYAKGNSATMSIKEKMEWRGSIAPFESYGTNTEEGNWLTVTTGNSNGEYVFVGTKKIVNPACMDKGNMTSCMRSKLALTVKGTCTLDYIVIDNIQFTNNNKSCYNCNSYDYEQYFKNTSEVVKTTGSDNVKYEFYVSKRKSDMSADEPHDVYVYMTCGN